MLSTVTKLLKEFIPKLSHEADGLIFQVLKIYVAYMNKLSKYISFYWTEPSWGLWGPRPPALFCFYFILNFDINIRGFLI